MKMTTRAQLAIPFNWIFVLVGGTMFLLFFFLIIRQVMTADDESQRRQLTFDIETAIAASPSNPGVFSVLGVRSGSLEFVCELDSVGIESYVRVNNGQFDPAGMRFVPFFSPHSIQGDELFLSTRKWNAPFAVTTLVMVSNNRTRYVFVTPRSRVQQLEDFLKDENLASYGYDIVIADSPDEWPGTYEDRGYDQYRVIFFGTAFEANPRFGNNKKNTALVVEGTTKKGIVTFYDSLDAGSANSRQITFYGESFLSAAIFSQNIDHFDCNLAKVKERWVGALDVLAKRAPLVMASADSQCSRRYQEAQNILENMNDDPARFTREDISKLDRLEAINRLLLTSGCTQVY